MKHNWSKKFVSFVITAAMLVTMIPAGIVSAATSSQFIDFPAGTWSEEAMDAAVNNGLLYGKSANTIEPQSCLTRAEMAAVINRAFGAEIAADISSYTDVSQSAWYYNDMAVAVNMQTFEGDGSGHLYPENYITREEVFSVLARALVYETDDFSSLNKFADNAQISQWAKEYLSALAQRGYISGDENSNVNPQANITREEFAQLMHNIFKTYISLPSAYSYVNDDSVMINSSGATLVNVTVNGDVVIGDGVGFNPVSLTNVKIKGRLVARAGSITLTNVTAEGGVVVKNVNGETHFNNYKTDEVFNGVQEYTYTTYKTGTGSSTIGGGSGSGSTVKYTYTVRYYLQNLAQNGYDIQDKYTYNGKANKNSKVSAVIKNFEGFTYDETLSKDSQNVVLSYNLMTLDVYYTRNTYDVTKPDGTKITYLYGQKFSDKITLDDTYTDGDGNTFIQKWFFTDESGKETEIDNDSIVLGSGTLSVKHYATVSFDLNYATTSAKLPDIIVEKGKTAGSKFPSKPERYGYTFVKWTTAPDGGSEFTADTAVNKNITVYAQWSKNAEPTKKYTVTFNYNYAGASEPYAQVKDIESGNSLGTKMPANPERDGYVFKGWRTESGDVFTSASKVTANITVYAQWNELKNVIFKYNYEGAPDGDYKVLKIEKGTKIGDFGGHPTRDDDFSFVEWNTKADGTGDKLTVDTVIDDDLIVYAVWKDGKEYHSVTFYYGIKKDSDMKIGTVDGIVAGSKIPADDVDALWNASPNVDPTYMYMDGYVDGAFTNKIYGSFIYKDGEGNWLTYTADTQIDKNMDIFYSFKYVRADATPNITGIDIGTVTANVPYNTNMRIANTVKDAVWLLRTPFENAITQRDAENKIIRKIADKTGIIDYDGNILIKDFELAISRVISSDDIDKQAKQYVKDIIVAGGEDLKDVLNLIDTKTLIKTIGLKKLINAIGYDEVRDALKSDECRDKLIDYIRDLLQNDANFRNDLLNNSEFIEKILETDSAKDLILSEITTNDKLVEALVKDDTLRDKLIDQMRDDENFVASLLDNDKFKTKVLDIIKESENAQKFKDILNSSSAVKSEIIDIISKDDSVKALINNPSNNFKTDLINQFKESSEFKTLLTDTSSEYRKDIIDKLTSSNEFKDLLKNNADLRAKLINAAKDSDDFKNILTNNEEVRNEITEQVKQSDDFKALLKDDLKGYRTDIISTIKNSSDFNEKLTTENTYRTSILDFVKKSTSFKDILLNNSTSTFRGELIDKVIKSDEFKAQLKPGAAYRDDIITAVKSSDEFKQKLITDNDYLNEIIAAVKANSDFDGRYVNDDDIKNFIKDYINGSLTDAELYDLIDEEVNQNINETITKYANGDSISDDIRTVIESEAEKNISDNLSKYANSTLADGEIKNVIDTNVDKNIKSVLEQYAQNAPGMDAGIKDVIDTNISENIGNIMTDYADGNSINADIEEVINTQVDNNIKDVITKYATGDTSLNTNVKDVINSNVDVKLGDIITRYANDDSTLNADVKSVIDSELDKRIDTILNDYVNNPSSLDAEIKNRIDETINDAADSVIDDFFNGTPLKDEPKNIVEKLVVKTVEDYIDGITATKNPELNTVIENNVMNYVKDYLTGKSTLDDQQVKDFVSDVKDKFIQSVKDADVTDITSYVVSYVQNTSNKTSVENFVNANYDIISDYIKAHINDADIKDIVDDYVVKNAQTLDKDIINNYIESNFDTFVTNEFIDKFVDEHGNDDDVYDLLSDFADADTIVEYVDKLKQNDKANNTKTLEEFADSAVDMLDDLSYYTEFIQSFKNGDKTYHVDKDNIQFVSGVGNAIENFDFDKLVDIMRNKGFGKIIDLIGLTEFEKIFNESKTEYNDGIKQMKAEIEADPTKEFDYKASLSVHVNAAEVIKNLFNENKNRIYNKLSNVGEIKYNDNTYLKTLVETDPVAEFLNYDASKVSGNITGYSIKGFMEYYDIMYQKLLLTDKSLLWYGDISEQEMASLEDWALDYFIKSANKLVKILNDLNDTGTLPGGYNLEELAGKVDKVKEFYDKYEDQYKSLLEKFANSKLNRTYDDTFINNHINIDRVSDILTGKDGDDIFNVDTLYDKAQEKAGDKLNDYKVTPPTHDAETSEYIDSYGKTYKGNSAQISRFIQ